MLSGLLEAIFNGISIGSVLLISALGLAIVFGLMGVINLAHGELMMLGAYTTFVVQNIFKLLPAPLFEFYIFFALIAAFIVAAAAGLVLERGVIRFLYGRPLETLLATWGVSLILQQFVRSISWVLTIAIVLFCLLFFGGMSLVKRRSDFDRIRQIAIAIILPLSIGISSIVSILHRSNFQTCSDSTLVWCPKCRCDCPGLVAGWLTDWRFSIAIQSAVYHVYYYHLFSRYLSILCKKPVGDCGFEL